MELNSKSDLVRLRTDIDQALDAVGTIHNIKLSLGAIAYDASGNEATGKLIMRSISDSGKVFDPRRQAFKEHCAYFGLQPSDLDRVFKDFDGRRLQISGLNLKARRYPINLKTQDGKTLKASESTVKHWLANQGKEA